MKRSVLYAFLALISLLLGRDALSQSGGKLTRDDVVVRRDKPSIYICVDKESMKKKEGKDSESLWLRVNNNTIWTIRFDAERMGIRSELLKLSNGTTITALTGESVAFPHYQFASKKTRAELSMWGDVSTANWLPSNTSALFKAPAQYFKDNLLFLEYSYEWEFIGGIGRESYPPEHRVYFSVYDASDLTGAFCE